MGKKLSTLQIIFLVLAIIGIAIYWGARMGDRLSVVAIVQPAITILCIFIALLSLIRRTMPPALAIWVSVGLAIALLGDFLNLDMSNPFVVIRGLIIFVVAYLTYAIGLTVLNGFQKPDLYVGIVALAAYAGLMIYLMPFLGDMKIPGLIYGLILPFLVTRAISTLWGGHFTRAQAMLLIIGTGMVYLGDIEFALHSYAGVVPMVLGPIFYAGGQLVISLSPSFGKAVEKNKT